MAEVLIDPRIALIAAIASGTKEAATLIVALIRGDASKDNAVLADTKAAYDAHLIARGIDPDAPDPS